MLDDALRMRLQTWLSDQLNAPDLSVQAVEPMSGGSIQENWKVGCAFGSPQDRRDYVLRKDAPATISSSRPRHEEFRILEVAHAAGVLTPEPIGFCDDPGVFGAPFALVGMVRGVALGPRIAKDPALGGDRRLLAERLGRELAKIHAVRPPNAALAFLGEPPAQPARAEIQTLRATLDDLGQSRPSIEWGLRWAELAAPLCAAPTLVHRDFRTGNYMVDEHGLTAVLDWEFAGWGDPMADLGWFCAECWRFGKRDLEAGGIGPRAAFYAGYEAQGGAPIDDEAVRYWEVVAHLRWAVIALEQGQRHLSGSEPSLELALTGRLVPELERAVLQATPPGRWRASHA